MTRRRTIMCLVALCCLFRAEIASAQPRWGRERLPEVGACFFEDAGFRGRYFCIRPGERLREVPRDMNDAISSVRLLGAAEVTVFRDGDFRGRSARFIGDVRDLRREGWNDQISSIEVGRGRGEWRNDRAPVWGRERAPREGACFYEEPDFKGRYFCAPRGATYTTLPSGFNDHIASIRVFGAEVRIFQDRDFRGRSAQVGADLRNLRGTWRDSISSIRVF